ncbi:DUF7670 domain-containing protein [Aegicerativicinus sediminis]
MKTTKIILNIIIWAARIWGGLVIAFVGSIIIGHLFSPVNEFGTLSDLNELVVFICFPIATLLGLLLAYKWEFVGGAISTIAMIILAFISFDIPSEIQFILGIYTPGILYLFYSAIKKGFKTQ